MPVEIGRLESHLWEAANILRGPVDAADFKTYVFPLLFFKRISDVHDEEHADARIERIVRAYEAGEFDGGARVLAGAVGEVAHRDIF